MRLSTVGIGKKDHSKQSDTQVALRRTLQIGHRSGNALKKIAGPSVRVYTVLWSHGSHLNNNSIDRRHSTFSCRAESMQQNNEHAEG
jgi:hypothetical protein